MTVRSTIHLAGRNPEQNLAVESSLFDRARSGNEACCLFYINNPCIILGRNNEPGQWVRENVAAAAGIPVLRRISGGGTVYHDADTLSFSFIAPRESVDVRTVVAGRAAAASAYINFFRQLVIRALSPLGRELVATRTSDISIGGRKFSGNAQRIAGRVILHHGTLLTRCPLAEIEKYLPIPPDRPGIDHREFVTGLAEEGLDPGMGRLKSWLAAEFWRSLG